MDAVGPNDPVRGPNRLKVPVAGCEDDPPYCEWIFAR